MQQEFLEILGLLAVLIIVSVLMIYFDKEIDDDRKIFA